MNEKNVKEQYNVGQMLLNDMNTLNDDDLKEFLKDLLRNEIGETDEACKFILSPDGEIERTIKNNNCTKIIIYFHDGIEITVFGIYYKPEHGVHKQLLSFWMVEAMRRKFFPDPEF